MDSIKYLKIIINDTVKIIQKIMGIGDWGWMVCEKK